MFPILAKLNFGFGVIEIRAYSFFLLLATAVSIVGVLWYGRKKFNFPINQNLIALAVMIIFGLIGARMLNVFLNFGFYQKNPAMITSLDSRGFSLFGGIILGGLAGIIFTRLKKINLWDFADMYAPFLGIGIIFLRIGCFLNGCCFGKETNMPWGITFPNFSQTHFHQLAQNSTDLFVVQAVHPTQLYELFGALLATILAFWLNRKKINSGMAILTFLILFSLVRWINYYFRVMPETFEASKYFYPLFYGIVICACGYLLYNKLKKYTKK